MSADTHRLLDGGTIGPPMRSMLDLAMGPDDEHRTVATPAGQR